MKVGLSSSAAALAALLPLAPALAEPVTDAQAAAAAESFVAAGGAMDARLEGGVSGVRALAATDGATSFRVVKFASGGFIVTSGDTEDDPFVFISDGAGDVVEDAENPLWGILRHDMSANEAARSAAAAKGRGLLRITAASPANKWSKWLPGGGRALLRAGEAEPGTSISDICVPRIMDVRWNQRGSGNAPHYFNDAIPHHCAVGCVAVAMAQIIRHYQWPSTIGSVQKRCGVWNGQYGDASSVESVLLTTSGATYDWSAMPAAPDLYANPSGQAEVSRFLYDAGITVRTNWKEPEEDSGEDGGSGGSTIREAAEALKDVWHYADAVWTPHNGVVPEEDPPNAGDEKVFKRVKDIYLPCLAAGMPVLASIGGHDVVADGYGYSDGNLYFHINYGWGGTNSSSAVTKNTGWYYSRGPIHGHENGLGATVYNISTNRVGSLFSGRVHAVDGSPLVGIPVFAVGTNGVRHVARANAAGVYVFNLEPGTYVVSATNDDAIAYGEVATRKNKSTTDGQSQGIIGNVSEVDLHLVRRQGSFSFWTGAGDGTRFGDPANWDPAQVPAPGATIVFPAVGSDVPPTTLNNDLAEFRPAEIVFMPHSPCYTVTNNPISGLGAIVNSASCTNVFKVAVAFAGDIDVTGRVAFADGGSANGAKPVNHAEFLGLYNLSAPDWEPGAGATIPSNSVVNVPSMLLQANGNLVVRDGGTLNVAGDLVLTLDTPGHAARWPIAKVIDGIIDVGGWVKALNGASGSPCTSGHGTIRAYGIYNDSRYGDFRLCNSSYYDAFRWEIGAGGLATGPNLRGFTGYSCSVAMGDGVEIKALADFSVQGGFYMYTPVRLDTAGHTIKFEGLISDRSSIAVAGGGTVRVANDVRGVDLSGQKLNVKVNVEAGSTLALDSGSLLTTNQVTVAEGATLALTLSDPAVGATLGGKLSMAAGSTFAVSNCTGAAFPPLAVRSFEKTGEGQVLVRVTGPSPSSGRILLADGFAGASADDFECVECNVLPGGAQYSFDLSDGRLVYGTPAASCAWKGTMANWGDAAAWRNLSDGADMTWADMNSALFTAPAHVVLSEGARASEVSFAADVDVVGDGTLSTSAIFVSPGATASVSAPLSSGVVKTGGGTLSLSRSRAGLETILSEGTLRFAGGGDIGSLVFGTDPAKKVALDYGGHHLATPLLTDLLRVGMDETLTNGVFGTGTNAYTLSEANLPAVLTIAKGAVVSNEQHKISMTAGGTRVINIAGGKMYSTKNNNHWLMQASPSGRLDINVTDGGLLEYWYELYALTCRDGTGYVDPSLRISMKDSTFRIKNNKSFRFGLDGNNKNAVSPVGVFAATNSVFEAYGFFLGNDKVGTNTVGSYTADFEGCIVSARQFRVFHDRPLNAVRFSNTRLVLTAGDTKWLTAADEFNSVWNVDPITVGEGGLVLDSNGYNGSLVANLQGPGAVVKAGRGKLTVSRSQTGTGPFVCQAGTTLVEPGLAVARPISVRHAATLKVDGSTKVSLGDLALDSGATLDVKGCTADAAPLSVTALALSADGPAELCNNGGSFSAGIYAVLEMPGVAASQVFGKLLPWVASGLGYVYVVENGVLKLVVSQSGYTYVAAVAPTCEQPGNIAHLEDSEGGCYDLGLAPLSQEEVVLAPLGHDWGGWTVVTPASFTDVGEEERSCRRPGCTAHETREIPMLRHSAFTVARSGNGFIVTRSETNAAETVLYRTVGLSAYAGQHFTALVNSLSFAAGERDLYVAVSEKTPSADVYKFQTGTTRSYRFELTDEGGFVIEGAYVDKTMTTGTSVHSSGAFDRKSLAPTSSSELLITDSGYASNPGLVVNATSFFGAAAPKAWFEQIGAELRTTVDFKVREKNNGYQYVQILKDNSSSCDDRSGCSDGNPGNISLSRYMAGFDHDPGSKNGNYAVYSFPVTNRANNCSEVANAWNNGVDNKLYTQKFNTGCRAGDGRLLFPLDFTRYVIRFNASGGGTDHDEWYVTNAVVRIQAVDGVRPAMSAVSVAPGRHARGNNVYVSVAFGEIVVKTGTPYIETTWGRLYYVAGSGSNVLTFGGKIKDDASLPLSVESISGTITDLAGNSLYGPVAASGICALDESYAYPIEYNLSGGMVDAPNPSAYTYDDATFALANPTRAGYRFDGWSGTDIEGLTNEVVIARHSRGAREYKAHWSEISKPPYPAYLDGAPDEVLSNYDEWAAKHGYDTEGVHEAAFLLDVAPEALADGVTPLAIVELGTTNVVVEGSYYEILFEEFMVPSPPETLSCRRIVLESGAGALKPGPWREYNGSGGAGLDICNGYLVLHFGTDLSQPRGEWLSTSWFVDFEGDRAVVTIPEVFLENARGAIENATGRASGGLFLTVGIATDAALDADSFTLLVAE